MDKITETKVEQYFEELKELGVEAKLELIKRLCASLEPQNEEKELENEVKLKKGRS